LPTPSPWDRVWTNCHIATMAGADRSYGAIEDAAVAARGGRIVWVGEQAQLTRTQLQCACERIDLQGAWVTPGLIDPHTHLAFAGERSGEFERRLRGASYEEILQAGGGILSTVRAVRAVDETELVRQTLARAALLASAWQFASARHSSQHTRCRQNLPRGGLISSPMSSAR